MECVIVHDLFLNETANYAHVFLPGSTFLEKNGTFTNAERRINRVRKVMAPRNGFEDWEVTQLLANAMLKKTGGAGWTYTHPAQIMEEIAMTTPSFAGVTYEKLETLGSVQWPCNEAAPEGTPLMHVDGFVRGKGKFINTEYVATDEKTGPRFPLLLTTGRILSQYNVGAQTRRTANVVWHDEDVLEIHPHDAEVRGIKDDQWVRLAKSVGRHDAAGQADRPGQSRRGLHHLPSPRYPGQRHYDRLFGLGNELPGIQGDGGADIALERPIGVAGGLCRAGEDVAPDPVGSRMMEVSRAIPRLCFGAGEAGSRPLPEEVAVALSFNGTTQAVMMATPGDLVDFAYGFALTEGIAAPSEIDSVEVVEAPQGLDVQIWLKPLAEARLARRRRTMAGPVGCGLCGIDSLAEAVRKQKPVPKSSFAMKPGAGHASHRRVARRPAAARRDPRCSCRGFWDGALLATREDVGRHNALDKLIGHLLRNASSPSGAILLTSRGQHRHGAKGRGPWRPDDHRGVGARPPMP